MSAQLKAGVIGLGILGAMHAEYLHGHPDVDLVAVADLRQEAADRTAAKVGAKAYTDYRAMLKEQALDLVVVATPDPLHREPVMAALEAGVANVIGEKPLATTLEDAEAIYNAVEQRNARFFIDFSNRAAPMDVATRYVVQQGLLGKVVYGDCRVDDNITVPTKMWGDRTRAWAAGSSTAHFLFSHIVDLFRWYMAPAEVTEVYAIVQKQVLGYTPDLYDAYLTFNTGLKARIKAEWTKHIDELVEFYTCLSGSEGTLIYNKLPSFGTSAGWRANLSQSVTAEQLLAHQSTLLGQGANVGALLQRPNPTSGPLVAGGGELAPALEYRGACAASPMALMGAFIAAILEGTYSPKDYAQLGALPNHLDGLRQTQVVSAIIESSETGRVVEVHH
ncbi:MAG: Gfo/Idh/MocA family protein [Anaerolineae bacterium]